MTEKATEQMGQGAAVVVAFSEPVDQIREHLPAQAHFTFAMSDGQPTVAFTLPDGPSEEFEKKVRALGDLSFMISKMAFQHRNFDCEEDDRHSRWGNGYA